MKKFFFLFLILSSQFAYGEEGVKYGCGDNNTDTVVYDAVAIHVLTTTGTDPFKLGTTSATSDSVFIIYNEDEGIISSDEFAVSYVCIQQLGDSMAILLDNEYLEVLEVYRVLPDTELHYHVYAP